MRIGVALVVLLALATDCRSEPLSVIWSKFRVADATYDACIANCESQNASCKRVCPTTLRTPCVSACDSQMQTCRQSCQAR